MVEAAFTLSQRRVLDPLEESSHVSLINPTCLLIDLRFSRRRPLMTWTPGQRPLLSRFVDRLEALAQLQIFFVTIPWL